VLANEEVIGRNAQGGVMIAQRRPGHHPKRGIRQGVDSLGMNILIKNTVEKGPNILKLQEATLLSVNHIALRGRLC
jgi:hypothetical protein